MLSQHQYTQPSQFSLGFYVPFGCGALPEIVCTIQPPHDTLQERQRQRSFNNRLHQSDSNLCQYNYAKGCGVKTLTITSSTHDYNIKTYCNFTNHWANDNSNKPSMTLITISLGSQWCTIHHDHHKPNVYKLNHNI